MNRSILLLIFSVSFLYSKAQIPAGYYDAAAGLNCQPLKTALKNIVINGSTVMPYNPSLWNSYPKTDFRLNDAGTDTIVWDMYTDLPTGNTYSDNTPEIEFVFGEDQDVGLGGGFEGDKYNREHIFPQSWFDDALPMRTDIHHVFPTDKRVNGIRGNLPFGEVNKSNTSAPDFYKSKNLSYRGNAVAGLGYSGTVFEPIDEYKGDIARAQLYMAVRYEDLINSWTGNGEANLVLLSAADEPDADKRFLQVYDDWYLNLLFKWHQLDPVSTKEISRNDSIYYAMVDIGGTMGNQGNRNPFIDHPEYVYLIWQCSGLVPITLENFTATLNNGSVLLKWKATEEINFSKFIIEKSEDGISYRSIGEVAGNNLYNYGYVDNDVSPSISYYRLKLVDLDGQFKYSKVEIVKNGMAGSLLYPNPAVGFINLDLKRATTSPTKAAVIDATGRTVIAKTIPAGSFKLAINVSSLLKGKYVLKFDDGSSQTIHPFVVQ